MNTAYISQQHKNKYVFRMVRPKSDTKYLLLESFSDEEDNFSIILKGGQG